MRTTNIAILITCHNRKEKTLTCLNSIFIQKGFNVLFKLDVFLVDDGSTDGTSDAIKNQFPTVKLINGNGKLFWNRGMHLAWKTAIDYSEYDYYLWLNDDTYLHDNAINTLIMNSQFYKNESIIIGTTTNDYDNQISYGGHKFIGGLVSPKISLEENECEYFNGNCVLIPRKVKDIVGILDPFYTHAIGDYEYSLRAKKLGVKLVVSNVIVGLCNSNLKKKKWLDYNLNLLDRFSYLYSPLSGNNPFEFFVYERKYFGLFSALKHFIWFNLCAILPRIFK